MILEEIHLFRCMETHAFGGFAELQIFHIKKVYKVHDCDYHPDVFHNNAKWQGIFDSRIFGAPIFHLTIANRLSKLNQSHLLENKPLLLP